MRYHFIEGRMLELGIYDPVAAESGEGLRPPCNGVIILKRGVSVGQSGGTGGMSEVNSAEILRIH
jgi:hypothetical protein